MNYKHNIPLAAATLLLPMLQDTDEGGIPWWIWLIVILVILFLGLIVILRQEEPGPPLPEAKERPKAPAPKAAKPEAPAAEEQETDKPAAEEPMAEEPAAEEPMAEKPAAEEPAKPDDLKVIEGIGPKISGVLQDAGVTTYAKLAETSSEQLKEILAKAKIRIGDPTTWPEQAKLAAKGDWQALEKLQDDLKGGRRS